VKTVLRHAERFLEQKQLGHQVEAAIQKIIDGREGEVLGVDITGLRWTEVDFAEDHERARDLFERYARMPQDGPETTPTRW
jgi:choline kinase